MTQDQLIKVCHILLGKLHMFEAGEGSLTASEWNLIYTLSDWYNTEGKLIAENKRLTQMQIVLD